MNTNLARIEKDQTNQNTSQITEADLGARLGFYPGKKRGIVLGIGIFAIFVPLCDMILILSENISGKSNIDWSSMWWIIFPVLVWFGGGAYAIWYYFQTRNNSFTLFEKGFSYTDHLGDFSYQWEEIKEVYYKAIYRIVNGISAGTYYEFKFNFLDGDKFKLGSGFLGRWYPGMDELGVKILDKTAKILLPSYEQRFETGQQVNFGSRVSIDKGKIYDRGKSLNWSEVKQLEVKSGVLTIKKGKKNAAWDKIHVYDIANLMVLLELARQVTSVEI